MTRRLFQADSYLREFDAVVTGVDDTEGGVMLDQTAFYPGGGGQPCDLGLLSQQTVKAVRRSGAEILHLVGGELPEPGTMLHGVLDWERRYNLMRTHTAMHILCGVVFRDYGALVTGGAMDPLRGRMDFEFAHLERSLVSHVEMAVNAEIEAAREVRVRVLPKDEATQIPDLIRTKINLLPPEIQEVRVVEISGLDVQADGGTHVKNTTEVGSMRIVDYKSKGSINKRIYVEIPVMPAGPG